MAKLLSVLIFFTLSASAQDPRPKVLIDTSQISSVEILKTTLHKKTGPPRKTLTQKQYIDFAQKWNTSKKLGADKYNDKYSIYISLKNGEVRRFSIKGVKIQESWSWQTYVMDDKQYFDKIWAAIK
jgi:hypothetical protein